MLKKLRLKFILVMMTIVAMMLGIIFGMLYFSTSGKKETEKSTDTKITAEKNGERKETITLPSVTGNKITYIEQETEEVEETLSENTAGSGTEDAAEKFPEGAEFRKSGKGGFGEDSQTSFKIVS